MAVATLTTELISKRCHCHLMRAFNHVMNGGQHDILDLQQPFLHGSSRLTRRYGLVKLDPLHFAAIHAHNVQLAVKFQIVDSLETFLQMRLDARRVFRF